MRIGVSVGHAAAAGFDAVRQVTGWAIEQRLDSVWVQQIAGAVDALTAIAGMGHMLRDVSTEIGTAVVAVQTRHPLVLASQVRTAQQAGARNLTLGLGVSHPVTVENVYGLPFRHPLSWMREHLEVVRDLLEGRTASIEGDTVRTESRLMLASGEPVPIVVAALGPRMLELAGRLADGTVTWMAGPRTILGHIVPEMAAAAESAGRPPPRVIAGVPVCVTSDVEAARAAATAAFGHSKDLPSYAAMLAREGVSEPADLAVIGPVEQVAEEFARYEAVGATDLAVMPFGSADEWASTMEALGNIRASSSGSVTA